MTLKRTRTRTAKWNLIFHYSSIGYSILSGIVLVPLYLRYIPDEVYGIWLAATNILFWIAIVDPGLSTVLMQKTSAAYGASKHHELNGLLTNGLILSFLIAAIVFIGGYIASHFLFSILGVEEQVQFHNLKIAFIVATLGTSIMIFSYGITAFNQGLQSSLGIGVVFVVTQASSLILMIFLLSFGYELMALSYSLLFRGCLMVAGNLIYLIWRCRQENIRLLYSTHNIKELTNLMSFTFLGRGVGTLASSMDAFIITRYLGPELAPVFVLTRKVPEISKTFLERPSMALMPIIASLTISNDSIKLVKILLRLFLFTTWGIGITFIGFFLLNGAFIKLWVGEKFYAGNSVNLIILIQIIILIYSVIISNICYSIGNIKGNSIVTFIQGVISIPLMIIGVKYFGMIGLIIGPLIATSLIYGWYYPRILISFLKIDNITINIFLKEVINIISISILCIIIFSPYKNPNSWISLFCIGLMMLTLYTFLLYIVSKEFKSEVKNLLKKIVSKKNL